MTECSGFLKKLNITILENTKSPNSRPETVWNSADVETAESDHVPCLLNV